MNKKYKEALNRKIEIFKSDFLEYSRSQYSTEEGQLTHPGSFGNSREKIVKNLIDSIIPGSKECHVSGFIMNSSGALSKEQDLIFYDKINTPVLTVENIGYFPVETVAAVGQIKSIIKTKQELEEALKRLSEVKKIRDEMQHSSVIWRTHDLFNGKSSYSKDNVYDQIFTFIVCEKIKFKITPEEISDFYDKEKIPAHLRHNLIFDVTDGIYSYRTGDLMLFVAIPAAVKNKHEIKPSFISSNENLHFTHLLNNISIFVSGATIYHPDMAMYISDNSSQKL